MQYEKYKKGIIEAYKVLRLENNSIPPDIIDFIKNASLKELERLNPSLNNNFKKPCPECSGKIVPSWNDSVCKICGRKLPVLR